MKGLLKVVNGAVVAVAALALGVSGAKAQESKRTSHELEEHEVQYVYGYPSAASEPWVVAIGGRVYDNWINVLDKDAPDATHPAWPASNTKKKGGTTWRCKSCHGWDFLGAAGKYGSGSYKTGIKGVRGVIGMDPNRIHKIIMNDTHKYTYDMIPKPYTQWLSAFLSKGQYDITYYVDAKGNVNGNPDRGKGIFQNVCAACHGFAGTALNWGDEKDPNFIGTEANANPWEVFAKIRHGHPGVEMVSLAAFPMQDAADVLAFAQTLPEK